MTMPNKGRRELPLVQLLPNMMTVAALCAGVTAIRMAITGRFDLAVGLIIIAAIFDALDGRLARLLKSESEIGAELDSLCDFVNFGVAPGIILYQWALLEMPRAGWIAVLVYIVCALLRLARFNIGNRSPETPTLSHFVGVPSPAGAMLALLPLFLAHMLDADPIAPQLIALWMIGVGAAMIARFPTPSFKSATIYAEHVRFIVVGFVALVAALVSYPWVTLVVLDLVYLGIVAGNLLLRLRKSRP
jgi:CDP-diacylglycerol--serine O-phosphatidyltransferase